MSDFENQHQNHLLDNQNDFVTKKDYDNLVEEFSKLKLLTQNLQQQLTQEIQQHDEQLKKQQSLWDNFMGNLNGLVAIGSADFQIPSETFNQTNDIKCAYDEFAQNMNSLTKLKSADKDNSIQEIKSQLDELKTKVNDHSNFWMQFETNCQSLMNSTNQSTESHSFADDIRYLAGQNQSHRKESSEERLSKIEKQSEIHKSLWEKFARNMDILSQSENDESNQMSKDYREFLSQIKKLLHSHKHGHQSRIDHIENQVKNQSLLWTAFIKHFDKLICDNGQIQSPDCNPSQDHLREFINQMKEMISEAENAQQEMNANEIKKEIKKLHHAIHHENGSESHSEKYEYNAGNDEWVSQIQNISTVYTTNNHHENKEESYEQAYSDYSYDNEDKSRHSSLKSIQSQLNKLQYNMKCVKYELKNCKLQLAGHSPSQVRDRNIVIGSTESNTASFEEIDQIKNSISSLQKKYEAIQASLNSQSQLWDQFDQSLRQLLNLAFAEMDLPTNRDYMILQNNIRCLKHEMKKLIEEKNALLIEDQMQRQAFEQVIKEELIPLAKEVSKLHSVCARFNNTDEDNQDPEDLRASLIKVKEDIKSLKAQYNSLTESQPSTSHSGDLLNLKKLQHSNNCLKYEVKRLKEIFSYNNSSITERSADIEIDDDTTHKLLDKISKLEQMNAQVLKNANELKRLKNQISSIEDLLPTNQSSDSSNNQQNIINELVIDLRDLKEEVNTLSQKHQKNFQFSDAASVSSNSSVGSNQLNQVSGKGSNIPDSTKISILAKEIKKLQKEQEQQSQLIQSLKHSAAEQLRPPALVIEPLNRPTTSSNDLSNRPSTPSLSSSNDRASYSPVKSSQYLMLRDEKDFEALNSKIVALELGYQRLLQNTQNMTHTRTNSTSSVGSNGPLSPGRPQINEIDEMKKMMVTFKKQIKALDSTIGEIKQQQAHLVKKDDMNSEISQIQLDLSDLKEGIDALKFDQSRLKKQATNQPHSQRNTTPHQSDVDTDEKQKEIEKLKVSMDEMKRTVAQMANMKKNIELKLNLDLEKMKTDIIHYVDAKIAGEPLEDPIGKRKGK